jgi:hypothetical protein
MGSLVAAEPKPRYQFTLSYLISRMQDQGVVYGLPTTKYIQSLLRAEEIFFQPQNLEMGLQLNQAKE